jgi:hypothetical protein
MSFLKNRIYGILSSSFLSKEIIMNVGFESEEAVKSNLRNQVIGKPIMGGIQVKKVYLTKDYAIHILRKRGASSLGGGLRGKVDNNVLLSKIDRWMNKHKSVFMHSLKQNIKIIIEVLKGNHKVLTTAKLRRTLNSLMLTKNLVSVIDPFIYLEKITVRKKIAGLFTVPTTLKNVVIKHRNDRFLDVEIARLSAEKRFDEIKTLIEKSVRLDEVLWSYKRFNTDLIFLGNTTVSNDNVLLRDLGAITDNREVANNFIKDDAQAQIDETQIRLSTLNLPAETISHYSKLAASVYNLKNLDKHWG